MLLTEESLKNAASYTEMIFIAESFSVRLIRLSKKDLHSIDVTAKLLLHSTQHSSLDWLANESCLSAKQFEWKFYERVGISPSLFARLMQS
jgi:AraC-like DNA-binding protein